MSGSDASMIDYGQVSIITPLYNMARFISDAINSVEAQSYRNWEMIIIDDCSTDGSSQVVAEFLIDPRIRYLKNKKNSGAAFSRNLALREAKGRWIAFLDSDDLWTPDKLEKQIGFMVKNNYDFSYTEYEEIDESSKERFIVVSGPRRITRIGMHLYCWPGCLTVMYDQHRIGLVQVSDIEKNNDYAMWIEVSRKSDCWLLRECLAKYRNHDGSISRANIGTLVAWHYRLWRKGENKNVISATLLTVGNLICGLFKKIVFHQRIKGNG